MKVNLFYDYSTGWCKFDDGTFRKIGLDALKEAIMSFLDCGWEVNLTAI